ncbi:hypothetical protein LguiA_010526 [Lonicera macranthoides]
MGSSKDERGGRETRCKKIVKRCIVCFGTFLISMVGGLTLGWWELRYHPTNSQLWMVPFGLVVFVTPAIIWFSIFISDVCNSKEDGNSSLENSVVDSIIVVSIDKLPSG